MSSSCFTLFSRLSFLWFGSVWFEMEWNAFRGEAVVDFRVGVIGGLLGRGDPLFQGLAMWLMFAMESAGCGWDLRIAWRLCRQLGIRVVRARDGQLRKVSSRNRILPRKGSSLLGQRQGFHSLRGAAGLLISGLPPAAAPHRFPGLGRRWPRVRGSDDARPGFSKEKETPVSCV